MRAEPGVLLFGGSFDPPHRTHQKILRAALKALPVARALVLPSGRHPHKTGPHLLPDAVRLELCELAFSAIGGVTVSDLELRRPAVCYTVDTLRELAAELPGQRLFLLIGSDNLRILDSWHDHHAVLELATVVTYPRLGEPVDRETLRAQDLTSAEIEELLSWALDVPADDVSATAIREQLARGVVPPELPEPVADRITALGLYGPYGS